MRKKNNKSFNHERRHPRFFDEILRKIFIWEVEGCFKQDLVVHFRAYMQLHILLICRTISGHKHILQEPGIVN